KNKRTDSSQTHTFSAAFSSETNIAAKQRCNSAEDNCFKESTHKIRKHKKSFYRIKINCKGHSQEIVRNNICTQYRNRICKSYKNRHHNNCCKKPRHCKISYGIYCHCFECINLFCNFHCSKLCCN